MDDKMIYSFTCFIFSISTVIFTSKYIEIVKIVKIASVILDKKINDSMPYICKVGQ